MNSSSRSARCTLVLALTGLLIGLVSNSLALDPGQSLERYRLVRWDEDQGLPPSPRQRGRALDRNGEPRSPPVQTRPVSDLPRDREGNIWLVTSLGLDRLSDVKFTTYTTRDGLPSDDVIAVAPGSSGRIWIGTNSGLACLNNGRIETTSLATNGEPTPEVSSLYEDPQGVLWFGLSDATLHRLEGGEHRQIAKLNTVSGPGYATGMYADRKGNFWVGTNGAGLQLFRMDSS
jgi:ligand-binding sensor domain-containing protein